MYVKDFVRELKMQDIKMDDTELEKLCKIADKTGKVKMQVWRKLIIFQSYF